MHPLLWIVVIAVGVAFGAKYRDQIVRAVGVTLWVGLLLAVFVGSALLVRWVFWKGGTDWLANEAPEAGYVLLFLLVWVGWVAAVNAWGEWRAKKGAAPPPSS